MSKKTPTYWVRSKQINETGGFGSRPVPAKFKTYKKAQKYRWQLHLHRGAFHPGYFIEVEEDSPTPFIFIAGTGRA